MANGVLAAWLLLPSAVSAGSNDGTSVPTNAEERSTRTLPAGVEPGPQIIGVDPDGIPIACAPPGARSATASRTEAAAAGALPSGARGWECVPGVIRDDGVEAFRLEVDVNGPVAAVTLDGISTLFVLPEPAPLVLRDDGLGEDRVAGDSVFTAGPFRFDTTGAIADSYLGDPTSPAGLDVQTVGTVTIEETDHTRTTFLLNPQIGLLQTDIPETARATLAADIAASPHLINVRGDRRTAQRLLRNLDGDARDLTNRVYAAFPDAFDFLVLFSTTKIERRPRAAIRNFNAGLHVAVQHKDTGTGRSPLDESASYGSGGTLLSVNVLDAYRRGLVSNNVVHELTHQWAAYLDSNLGLTDGTGHYDQRSSAASLVGGFLWTDNGDGSFTLNCQEGRNGAHLAPPLDRYLMGLIDGDAVPPLYVNQDVRFPSDCDAPVVPQFGVTISDIQDVHGVRTPRPAEAQRDFTIGFVAESHGRLLNPTEMTFYEILAAHFAKPVPPDRPDPLLGFNWVSIDRYFGERTTWTTALPPANVPTLLGIEGGLGALGNPTAFISPRSKTVGLDTVQIRVSEIVSLVDSCVTSTGGSAPSVVSLTPVGENGMHTLRFDGAIEAGAWTTIVLTVENAARIRGTLCCQIAHFPGDVNHDGQVNLNDATAFGAEFDGPQSLELADLNGDNEVNLNDGTNFGQIWRGVSGEGYSADGSGPWFGRTLPNRPTCGCP